MNSQLTSLLNALPNLSDSTDDLSHQVSDLVAAARKLGLRSAADYLEAEVNYFRKWYGQKPLHTWCRTAVIAGTLIDIVWVLPTGHELINNNSSVWK